MVTITSLQIENVKRIKAVDIQCDETGLTLIGGKNRQGKTSILDAIAWTLGGNKLKPSNMKRDDSVADPHTKITLSNGLIVERKGKNATLKVIDPNGHKSGQDLLNEFINEFALNLPKFMMASDAEKAQILLTVIGVGAKLVALELSEKDIFDRRQTLGQTATSKRKHFDELPEYAGVPPELISSAQIIIEQQEVLRVNAENTNKRNQLANIKTQLENENQTIINAKAHIDNLQADLEIKKQNRLKLTNDLTIAEAATAGLIDTPTQAVELKIADIDTTNAKIRANLDKEKARDEADQYDANYIVMSNELNQVRCDKLQLLENANLPLPGLSVEDSCLTYNGKNWDCMSGSEQLIVATAIVRATKKECGFVLMDKLEAFDMETLNIFSEWLTNENLQVIATRVSSGDECSIIIEDGQVLSDIPIEPLTATAPTGF